VIVFEIAIYEIACAFTIGVAQRGGEVFFDFDFDFDFDW